MAEWSKASVLKTDVGVTLPGVRIPLSPPLIRLLLTKSISIVKSDIVYFNIGSIIMIYQIILSVLLVNLQSIILFAHDGHQAQIEQSTNEPRGGSYTLPGLPFDLILRSTDEEPVVQTVLDAFAYLLKNRSDYPRFDEAVKRNVLENIWIEPKVLNQEGQEFFILVVRTQIPGRVRLLISSSLLKEKGYLNSSENFASVLAKEFQWVVSKADTAPKPKTVTSERDLQHAPIQKDQDITHLSSQERVFILRKLFDTYLRTIDDQKSLEGQPYYEADSNKLVQPDQKSSTVRFYDIRIREALEKIVSDPAYLKQYPKAVQSLLNGKIWNVAFVNVEQRDWATRTRVLPEEKAVKVGSDSRVIQPAAILINTYRSAASDDAFAKEAAGLMMGALSTDRLARVVAIEIEQNITEKSMRGHVATDEMSAPRQ